MSSRSSRSRNGGISFSISLVTPRAAETVRGWRRPAISSASSMNTTTLSSSATSANASRNADARPAGESPASREGNSSTNGQPSREATPLAKVVFPAPGAEQDDGPGRDKPQPGGELRAGQRKDDPPFDQLLLPDHPAELAPRVRTGSCGHPAAPVSPRRRARPAPASRKGSCRGGPCTRSAPGQPRRYHRHAPGRASSSRTNGSGGLWQQARTASGRADPRHLSAQVAG